MNITQTHIDQTVSTLIAQFEFTVSQIQPNHYRPHDDLFREWYGISQAILAIRLVVNDFNRFNDADAQIERIYQSHVERLTQVEAAHVDQQAFHEPAKTDTGLDLQAGPLGQEPSPPEASALGQGGAHSVCLTCSGSGIDRFAAPEYVCNFCGSPSFIHPYDQAMPPDYCHDDDHGYAECPDCSGLGYSE